MQLPASLLEASESARAKIRLGYPWWLKPFLQRDVVAITLGRRIYLGPGAEKRSAAWLERLIRHELAHVRQVNRLTLPLFLVLYVAEFAQHLVRLRSAQQAYAAISFEVEALAAEREEPGSGL